MCSACPRSLLLLLPLLLILVILAAALRLLRGKLRLPDGHTAECNRERAVLQRRDSRRCAALRHTTLLMA